jgi:pimeloyl-ACP methyl ester carboxylesterase
MGLLIAVAATPGCARLPPGRTDELPSTPRVGTVCVIRGYLDWYSTGMDRLAEQLRAAGVPAVTYREEQWGDLGDALLAHPDLSRPLVLVGFSYGADDAILVARRLAGRHRPVDLLVTIDPVTPAAVPANVGRCVNFYQPNGLWDLLPFLRGVPLHADAGAADPVNVNVRSRPDLVEPDTSHATIAGNEHVHRAIIELVRETGQSR